MNAQYYVLLCCFEMNFVLSFKLALNLFLNIVINSLRISYSVFIIFTPGSSPQLPPESPLTSSSTPNLTVLSLFL